MEERGIILTHNFKLNDQGGFTFNESLTAQELRKHLLYFDFVDFPRGSFMVSNLRTSEENKTLLDQNYIIQTDIYSKKNLNPGISSFIDVCGDSIIGQFEALAYHASENRKCVVSQNNIDPELIELFLPQTIRKKSEVVEIDLHNLLPIPTVDTSINEILEYKYKRNAELLRLRQAIDNLVIIASNDPNNLTNLEAIKTLENAIAEIDQTIKEQKFSIVRTTKKIFVNIPKEAISEFKSFIGSSFLAYQMFQSNPNIQEALAVGGTTAFVKAARKQIFTPNILPDHLNDFAYLYYLKKELK